MPKQDKPKKPKKKPNPRILGSGMANKAAKTITAAQKRRKKILDNI